MAVSKRFPADHLGPLLPPPEFAALVAAATGPAPAEALDDAVAAVARQQGDCWVSHATDGELRRRFGAPGAVDPLAELQALKRVTPMLPKLRLPRPAAANGKPAPIAQRAQLAALIDAGVRYLQLDGRAYLPLMQRGARNVLRAQGTDPDQRIAELLAADAAVLDKLVGDSGVKVAVCFHDIESAASQPFAADLDAAAAERVLHGLPVARFILDCGGCETAEDFAFLRRLPGSAEVSLGLVDALGAALPTEDELVSRIDAAAEVIDTDRFALSPRHALSLLASGRDPAEAWERQRQALYLLMDTASRAWGIDF